jgi:hypothetical protein
MNLVLPPPIITSTHNLITNTTTTTSSNNNINDEAKNNNPKTHGQHKTLRKNNSVEIFQTKLSNLLGKCLLSFSEQYWATTIKDLEANQLFLMKTLEACEAIVLGSSNYIQQEKWINATYVLAHALCLIDRVSKNKYRIQKKVLVSSGMIMEPRQMLFTAIILSLKNLLDVKINLRDLCEYVGFGLRYSMVVQWELDLLAALEFSTLVFPADFDRALKLVDQHTLPKSTTTTTCSNNNSSSSSINKHPKRPSSASTRGSSSESLTDSESGGGGGGHPIVM